MKYRSMIEVRKECLATEYGLREAWKEYFEDLGNANTKEQVGINMCCSEGAGSIKLLWGGGIR